MCRNSLSKSLAAEAELSGHESQSARYWVLLFISSSVILRASFASMCGYKSPVAFQASSVLLLASFHRTSLGTDAQYSSDGEERD